MVTETVKAHRKYLSFPFRMTSSGGARSSRIAHIREQVAQVILTAPSERVFLSDFGLGVQSLLFLPMTSEFWSRIETNLVSGVAEALRGEAEPGSITVSAVPGTANPEQLTISISYRLAALNRCEELQIQVSDGRLLPAESSVGGS